MILQVLLPESGNPSREDFSDAKLSQVMAGWLLVLQPPTEAPENKWLKVAFLASRHHVRRGHG